MIGLPSICVVDASVAVKLFLEEEGTEEIQRFFAQRLAQSTPGLLVPDLLFAECANVMWKRVRRGGYPETVARTHLEDLYAMDLQVTSIGSLVDQAFDIACHYGCPVYDAIYLALSERKGIPLLTADHKLVEMLQGAPFAIAVLG